jgi:SNF2 family DNA or RNA helicase
MDLQSMMQFLRLQPFHDDPALFSRYLGRPIKNGSDTAVTMLRTLMKSVSLRRCKGAVLSLDLLPAKEEAIVSVTLSAGELEAYTAVKRLVDDFCDLLEDMQEEGGGVLAHSRSVITFILRLRQLCLDISLVPPAALAALVAMGSRLRQDAGSGSSSSSGSGGRVRPGLTEAEVAALLDKFNSIFQSKGDEGAAGAGAGNDAEAEVEAEKDCDICMEPLPKDLVLFKTCKHYFCGR